MLTCLLRLHYAILSRAPISLYRELPPRGFVSILDIASLSDVSYKKGCLHVVIFFVLLLQASDHSWVLRNQAVVSVQAVASTYLYWAE